MSYLKSFLGEEYIVDKTPSNKWLETGNFTIQCWFNTAHSGPLVVDSAANISLIVQPNGTIHFTAPVKESLFNIYSVEDNFNDEDWYHVTAIKEGHSMSLFINGVRIATKETWILEMPTADKAAPILIGAYTNTTTDKQFIGLLAEINLWNKALTEEQVGYFFQNPTVGTEAGLVSHYSFDFPNIPNNDSIPNRVESLEVRLEIFNNSGVQLIKTSCNKDKEWYDDFPSEIPANDKETVVLTSKAWKGISCDVTYENNSGKVDILVNKNQSRQDSSITTNNEQDLVSEAIIYDNSQAVLKATLEISESIVVRNMRNLYNFLNAIRGKISRDQIETENGNLIDLIRYNTARQNFNLRIQLKPLVILYCKSTEEVQLVYKKAIENNLPIRVRSGGHDHEGECSGNDVVLIDLSRIDYVNIIKKDEQGKKLKRPYARIGPGNRFKKLTSKLARHKVMVPHGTCATVGIAGFTFGGGWGPWTREKGMCCEYLIGATIVKGDGSVEKLDGSNGKVPELLWALKGGGGMSYGIVTELVLEVFPLPEIMIKFELEWNPFIKDNGNLPMPIVPTIQVLKAWEKVIQSKKTTQLSGTNIKITAIPWDQPDYTSFDANMVFHNCIMYGYWVGDEVSLHKFIDDKLSVGNPEIRIDGTGGKSDTRDEYGTNLMNSWDRESFHNVQRVAQGKKGKPYPPDLDTPAPHKITCRLVEQQGLKKKGHIALLKSLSSPLISAANRPLGLFTYITLGAITGNFYQNLKKKDRQKSAFPHKDKLYTIQYQTWWNSHLKEQEQGQDSKVYERTNKALDWMQVCRDFPIPNTSGSFISFKDSSIPTETYFGDSYERLKEIKQNYSKDPKNHFRSRKTII